MHKSGQILVAAAVMAVSGMANAVTVPAMLVDSYPLLTAPNGMMGGPPVTINPNSSFTGQGLQFGPDEGPQVIGTPANSLFAGSPTTDYSIAFELELFSPSYQGVTTTTTDPFFGTTTTQTVYPFVKLIDFQGLQFDAGLYVNNDGVLEFKTIGVFGTDVVDPDTNYHFAFTRDRNGGLQAYLNGQAQFTPGVMDTNGEAIITDDSLSFLLDDIETTDPMAAGIFSFLEIYEGTLTPEQVQTLFLASSADAVPTPASLLLLAAGLLGLRKYRRRTNRLS